MRKLIAGIASVFLIVFGLGYASLSQAAATADTSAEYGIESIRSLETASRLRELALLIDFYDEVLTQSARNYAFTRDKKWEKRYRESEPKLIATLEEALEKGDRIDKEFLERIDQANLKLVEMEYRSIELVNSGQTQQAVDILESSQYWQQKKIYNQSLKAYVQRRGEALRGALLSTRREYPVIQFTDKEKKWLKAHPEIRLGFNPDMEPNVIVAEDGSLSGLLIEIYKKLQEMLGIDVKIEIEYWPKMIEKARDGTVDGLLAAAAPMALSLGMLQTKPFFNTFITVFARQDSALNVNELDDLKGLTIVYLKGDRFIPKILEPIRENCTIIEADSTLKSFTLVQSGKADVALGRNQDTYFLKKYVISDIKPIFSLINRPVTAAATIRADWPELVEILNKGIYALGEDRINNILSKWIELPASTKKFTLTEQEKTWLADHREMRLGVDPTSPPFEFLDATKIYSGIASDYVRRLNELMQVNMTPVPELSWSQVMRKAQKGEIDVLTSMVQTAERSEFLLFSEPYMSFPIVVLSREDAPFVNSVDDFESGKVAVIRDDVTQELLERDYPDRQFYLASNFAEALQALSKKNVDAFVGNLASITYTTKKLGLTNLKVAMTTPYKYELSFAVRKDWPELVDILNKSLSSISEAEKTSLHNRWINVLIEREIDWASVFQIVGIIALVGGFILIIIIRWNRTLSREVSERKTAEEAMRQSRVQLQAIIDNVQALVSMKDLDCRHLLVNKFYEEAAGVKQEDALGKTDFEIFPKKVADQIVSVDRKVMSSGRMQTYEEEVPHPDGTLRQYLTTKVPLFNDEGNVYGICGLATDITERKRVEESLRESRATARGLLDATQESLLLLDSEGIIVAVNQTAARRHQRTPEDLTGTNRFDILPQNLRESRKAHFNNVLQTGKPADFEDVRDGMVFHHMYYPVQDKTGAIIGVAIFAQEITERKHMEEELRRNVEELEQFSKLAIGREIKMIQLKKEINAYLNKQGLESKYEIVE